MHDVTPLRSGIDKDRLALAQQMLIEKKDGVIETIARGAGVPTQVVLEMLPAEQRALVSPERFLTLWERLGTWGEILFIVNTPDIVLECTGRLPMGSFGQGFFNIHGDSPIGGHIRADSISAIYLVDRLFHKRRSLSVQFFNGAGEPAFKVFVRRDSAKVLDPAQTELFEALRMELTR